MNLEKSGNLEPPITLEYQLLNHVQEVLFNGGKFEDLSNILFHPMSKGYYDRIIKGENLLLDSKAPRELIEAFCSSSQAQHILKTLNGS